MTAETSTFSVEKLLDVHWDERARRVQVDIHGARFNPQGDAVTFTGLLLATLENAFQRLRDRQTASSAVLHVKLILDARFRLLLRRGYVWQDKDDGFWRCPQPQESPDV